MKRALDLGISALGLVFLTPVLAAIALAILLDDGPPVLFRQERVGRNGVVFEVLKFRTMRPAHGGQITVGDDWRITRVGKHLRRWKLDELPQLINVLRGDMSLVGPRPEVPQYVRAHPDLFGLVSNLRPGITDPASIAYRNEAEVLGDADDAERAYREEILPDKIRISAEYAREARIRDDVRVILRTLGILRP